MRGRGEVLLRRLLPLALATLVAFPAAAAAATTPTVDEIVARYVTARGGAKKIRAVRTLRQKGRATLGSSREALVTRELKLPARTRFEFTVQGITGVYVSDGVHGAQVSPFDGDAAPRPLPEEVVRDAAEQADFEGPLVDWKAKGHRVELAGRETLGGRETYKLKVTLAGGAIRYDYLDAKSFHLVRTDSTRQVRGRPVRIETTFGDFKKAGGVLFPRLVEVVAAERPNRLRVVVDTIEVNPSLDDSRFELRVPSRP